MPILRTFGITSKIPVSEKEKKIARGRMTPPIIMNSEFSFLQIWPNLLKKSLMENFIFLCSVRMAENLQKYFSVIYTSNKLRMIFREIFTAKRNFLFFSIMWKSFECLFSQNFVRNNQSVITFTYFFQLQWHLMGLWRQSKLGS